MSLQREYFTYPGADGDHTLGLGSLAMQNNDVSFDTKKDDFFSIVGISRVL